MIKIYLPNNFVDNKDVDQIYDCLSHKIYSEQGELNISFTYCGIKKVLNSPAIIKEFLMAKDFYNYKFEHANEFLFDLINLPGQIKISSIISNTSKSESAQKFGEKYNKKNFPKDYNNLLEYADLTIIKFKKHANLSELQQYQIFDYCKLSSEDRNCILGAMDIPVCPYCNMNYTINYMHKSHAQSTADIDHFFLKSEYPEYSLCLYNFIPACPVCNQRIKAQKRMTRETHIYPHEDSFNGKSHFRVTNILELLIQPQNHAKLQLVDQKSDIRVEQSITDFRLNERYKEFSYFAEDLIEKVQIYNETYTKFLSDGIKDLFESANAKNSIFGTKLSEREYGRLSLGKLKQDILDQLGVFDT